MKVFHSKEEGGGRIKGKGEEKGFQKNTAKQEEKSWINENYSQRKEERKAMG